MEATDNNDIDSPISEINTLRIRDDETVSHGHVVHNSDTNQSNVSMAHQGDNNHNLTSNSNSSPGRARKRNRSYQDDVSSGKRRKLSDLHLESGNNNVSDRNRIFAYDQQREQELIQKYKQREIELKKLFLTEQHKLQRRIKDLEIKNELLSRENQSYRIKHHVIKFRNINT